MVHSTDPSLPVTAAFPRLQTLMAHTSAVLWQWQLDSGEIFRSGPVRALLGVGPDISADGYLDLVHPEDVGLIKTAVRMTRERHQPYLVQYRLLGPNGEQRWVEDEGEPVLDGRGVCVAIQGVARDISRLRQMELRVQDAERRAAQESQHLRRMYQLAMLDAETVEPQRLRRQLLDQALAVLDGQLAVIHVGGTVPRLAAQVAPALAPLMQDTLAEAIEPLVRRVLERGERVVIDHPDGLALQTRHVALVQAGIGGLYALPLRAPGREVEGVLTLLWCGPRQISYEHGLVLDVLGLRLCQLLRRWTLAPPPGRRAAGTVADVVPRNTSLQAVLDQLTPQQRRIAELMAEGQANREIASALGIAPNTVKAHVSTLLHRLGLHNRTQLAVLAQQGRTRGGVRPPPVA